MISLPLLPFEESPNPVAFGALLVPVVLVGLDRLERPARRASRTFLIVSLAIVLVVGAYVAWLVAASVQDPPEFDFLASWIPARAAAHGLNFYDPRSLAIPRSAYSPDFRAEILDVGYWYPPTTMLLALPIGLLPVHEAALVWYLLQLAALIASAVLLWRAFLPNAGPAGLAGCAALVLLLRTTLSTLGYGQTNFIELLCLLGLWVDRERPRGGVWLALAIVIKPFALALGAFLVIRRRWSGLAATLATLAALVIAATVMFGPATCAAYVRSNPVSRLPDYVYSQDVNDSLWGMLLRMRGLDESPLGSHVRSETIVAGVVVLALTGWAALRRALDDSLLYALVLVAGLMLYPGSLEHYSVLLLLPLLMVWARPEVVPGGRRTLGAVMVLTYLLIGLGYEEVFWAYGLLWAGLLALAARGGRPRRVAA